MLGVSRKGVREKMDLYQAASLLASEVYRIVSTICPSLGGIVTLILGNYLTCFRDVGSLIVLMVGSLCIFNPAFYFWWSCTMSETGDLPAEI